MRVFVSSLFLLIVFPAFSQIFSGRIIDEKGAPVPNATIFIYELKSGISADNLGEFRTNLTPGRYSCEASSLGYRREKFSISVEDKDLSKIIKLQETFYELKEVKFSGRGDKRGNEIMRKAIAKGPFYRYQLKEYQSEAYMKGTMKITALPWIVKNQLKKNKVNLVLNKLFLVESQSEIAYKSPNTYQQTIKAFSSTIPDEVDPGDYSLLLKSCIYDPILMGMISPLSPQALTYYNFVFKGIVNENGRVVNKIQIVPKKGGAKLFSGYICIVDETWNVSYAELTSSQSGIKSESKINYNEVRENIFLPTGYTIDYTVDIFGVKGVGKYYSSITYKSIEENSVTPQVIKKKTLTQKKCLEIKKDTTSTKVIVDSTAKKRDSTYWLAVRKLPLRDDEIKSYKSVDSLKIEYKKIETEDSVKSQNGGKGGTPIEQIIFGHKYKLGKKWYFSFGGLKDVVGDFNFVDGYQLGQKITLGYIKDSTKSLTMSPSLYYSTARKIVLWQNDFTLTYLPLKGGKLKLTFGSTTSDISSNSATSRAINSYSSFFYGYSPVKIMSKDYLELNNSIDIANGLRLDLQLSYQRREYLTNGNVKSIFGKVSEPNLPQNIYSPQFINHSALLFSSGVTYTPEYFYRVSKGGHKQYLHSAYPTFMLRFTVAPGSNNPVSSRFASVTLGVTQSIKLNIYSKINYNLLTGMFINKERLFFPDYKHFRANNIMLSEDDFDRCFLLLDNYNLSTPDRWVQGMVNYNSEYILLKHLPFLNSSLINESIHLHTLWLTETGLHHTEIGYSVGVNDMVRIGVFAGFRGVRYQSVGFRIAVPLLRNIH